MLDLLWLIPALPMVGFLLLVIFGPRLSPRGSTIVGVGSVGAAALVSILVGAQFLLAPPVRAAFSQTLWQWIDVGGLQPEISLYLDPLSLLMVVVVTFVGFFIHLYSAEFMAGDEGFSRFFAYMNLFVAAMVVLVLAGDLLLLYVGWEGVGLCSYLLIGFWYRDPANGRAARKAFLVTRIGDVALAVGLFLIFHELGTLRIQDVLFRSLEQWEPGSAIAVAAALLILGGAVGKSAQLPLQTWLPDAMAGPTPTSALIHAATMVTAGVYLIARTHGLFVLAPSVLTLVAGIGVVTMLLAGFSALAQSDIKRVLAYSTISQIGYMFVALGVGAWAAAMFHFMTHAFFKALLFLAAGVVIHALHHEHDIFRMGGLRKELPVAFWSFLIGGSALAGLPLVTSGFYSKDLILWETWASEYGSPRLWLLATAGVLLTALYTYRLIFLVFYGDMRTRPDRRPQWKMRTSLAVLAVFSIVAGFINLPGSHQLSHFLEGALPPVVEARAGAITELGSAVISSAMFLIGLALAFVLFVRNRALAEALASGPGKALHQLWRAGWAFDRLYNVLLVRPVIWLATVNQADVIDSLYTGLSRGTVASHRWLSLLQTGRMRWYATGIAGGAVLFLAVVLLS